MEFFGDLRSPSSVSLDRSVDSGEVLLNYIANRFEFMGRECCLGAILHVPLHYVLPVASPFAKRRTDVPKALKAKQIRCQWNNDRVA